MGRPRTYNNDNARREAKNKQNREYRARVKARAKALKDPSIPVSSPVIDLSALAPWERR